MSQVRKCDKCDAIVKKQDSWIAEWRIRDDNGALFDKNKGDLCEKCKDEVYKQFVDAVNT